MENKITLRDKLGISHMETKNNGPKILPHFKPLGLIQEEKFVNLMRQKDGYHKNIQFKSEIDSTNRNKKKMIFRKVDNPLCN